MNKCISKVETDEEREKREKLETIKRINRQIEKELTLDKKKTCLKILLLGTGESGKSTILKQMKIIHVNGFSESEKMDFIPNIRRNVRDSIMAIVVSMNKLQIKPRNFDVSEKIHFLQESFNTDYDYPDEFFDLVSDLWQDDDVQICFSRSNEYQLIDSAKYFLDQLDIIRSPDYIPTLQDILRCRKMTSGITEINFEVREREKNKINFKVLDVGGQQGERKRWIQLFGEVTAILFLADSSSFDQTLREDRTKNRLIDSLEVFNQAWMNRFLQCVPIIVFINKIDMLNIKIHNGHDIEPLIIETLNAVQTQSIVTRESQLKNRRSSLNYVNHDYYSGSNGDCSKHNDRNSPNLCMEPNSNIKNYDRKNSIRTIPSCSTRHLSKDNNFDVIAQIFSEFPWESFQPSGDERKEFLNSFPHDQNDSPSGIGFMGKKKVKDVNNIHPETIRTACYIKNVFAHITRRQPKVFDLKSSRRRKCLFYYTCAVNTDNIQKVLNGCKSFLMEEHLVRFGIL